MAQEAPAPDGDLAPMPAPPVRPTAEPQTTSYFPRRFDVVAEYNQALARDPDLTKPLAAIEALIGLLRASPTQTFSETVAMIKEGSERLKAAVANPIPLQAGTDLFQIYILRSSGPVPEVPTHRGASRRGKAAAHNDAAAQDFTQVRQHLLDNTALFASRAKEARATIAQIGARFVLDGRTVLTHGGSRTVAALLTQAAIKRQTQGMMFNVIYVESCGVPKPEGEETVARLRELGVPVATINEGNVRYALRGVEKVILGAETVCKNGGIISRQGTYQLAILAKDAGVPVWVAAETHKMSNEFPLGPHYLNVKQKVLEFKTAEDLVQGAQKDSDGVVEADPANMVDFTPPELITNIITEVGVKLPSAVFEFLVDIS